jgi:hypothetical protein
MSRDLFESICVVPNSIDNFDEIWVVVNRANGRFIERFVRRLKESSCGGINVLLDEQVFMDSTVSFDEGQVVQAITATNGALYTITLPNHGYSNGNTVRLRNVSGANAQQLNNTSWKITSVTTDTFILSTRVE